ncbi:MAG: penicillin-binding protein 2 [Gammaproteobacteria bacterium]
MQSFYTLRDPFKESQLHVNRTVVAAFFVLLGLLTIFGRLVYLQVLNFEHYADLAVNNQVRLLPVPPPRGLILDRHAEVLAENQPSHSLALTPANTKNLNQVLLELKQVIDLNDAQISQFRKQLKLKSKYEAIPLKMQLSEEEIAKFFLEKHRFPGVELVSNLLRTYKDPLPFTPVLGYVGPINQQDLQKIDQENYKGSYYIGRIGVENYYEKLLHGKVGFQRAETDAKGRVLRVLDNQAPINGQNLNLAIDANLQRYAYELLASHESKGAIVALDPNNGEVLTLVSLPSYDANLFVRGISSENYRQLRENPDTPLLNRALNGVYPPGSIIKPILAVKSLDWGILQGQLKIYDPGWFRLKNDTRLYKDWNWKKGGHGWVDLEKAIVESSDTYFWHLAQKLGVDKLEEIYKSFGLGANTGIDIAPDSKGLVPSREWKQRVRKQAWFPGETLNIGIGQGYMMVTPIQMAKMTMLLANKGWAYPLSVLKTEKKPEPIQQVKIEHPEDWEMVIQGMKKVIHAPNGTAYRISHGLKYTIAAKSGTAQVFSLKANEKYEKNKVKAHLRDHAWMIAFAPVENPKIAIAVLVENNHSGLAKDITRAFLDRFFENQIQKNLIK